MKKSYQIQAALVEEALDSWVWTNDDTIGSNKFIIIRNPKNGKSIKTFKRTIDSNFARAYNDRPNTIQIDLNKSTIYLVLNEYYRQLLGVQKNESVNLEISNASFIQKILKIHWTHPNPTVQFANRATVFSIIVGLIALLLTIYSVCLTIHTS